MKMTFAFTTTALTGLLLALGSGNSRAATNLFGIDVSAYQGAINWTSVHSCGAQYAFAKATEGVSSTDAYFQRNMNNGKAAGLKMGAYHFSRPDLNCPNNEADYFWSVAGGQIIADGKSLYPAVDFEVISGHSCVASYTAWFNSWASRVKSKTSHFLNPVISFGCAGACALGSGLSLQVWGLAPGDPWSTCPCCNSANPCTSKGWAYWRVTDNGSICGIAGTCDFDQFNGSLSNLVSFEVVH